MESLFQTGKDSGGKKGKKVGRKKERKVGKTARAKLSHKLAESEIVFLNRRECSARKMNVLLFPRTAN